MNKILSILWLNFFIVFFHGHINSADYNYKSIGVSDDESSYSPSSSGSLSCGCADCYYAKYGTNDNDRGPCENGKNISLRNIQNVQEKIDINSVAHNILNKVLQYRLRTANSFAAPIEEYNLMIRLREQSGFTSYTDSSGNIFYRLDNIFQHARSAIKHGVAFCGEYTIISYFFASEWAFYYPGLMIKIISGDNFDHVFLAIGHVGTDASHWLAIDPWLRKVFPLCEAPDNFKRARVGLKSGTAYQYVVHDVVAEHGPYHPAKYSLKNIQQVRHPVSTNVITHVSNLDYRVPYESPERYYDPEKNEMIIFSSQLKIIFNIKPAQ